MATPTPWTLEGATLNQFDIASEQSPSPRVEQTRPAVASTHGGENFGVIYFEQQAGGGHAVTGKFFDTFGSVGDGEAFVGGPLTISDGAGTVLTSQPLAIAGWNDGYVFGWAEDEGGQTVLKGRLASLIALGADEFSISTPAAGVNQSELDIAGGEFVLNEGLPGEAVQFGFAAVWVETDASGQRVLAQRYEIPFAGDAPSAPNPIAQPVDLGAGRAPSTALLLSGEQAVAWIDGNNQVQGKLFDATGAEVPVAGFPQGLTVPANATVEVAAIGAGGMGLFWVADDAGGQAIFGQTWTLPDGAAALQPQAVQKVVALPAGFSGAFSVDGFGDEEGGGALIAYTLPSGQAQAITIDEAGVPQGGPGEIGTDGGERNVSIAGQMSERGVAVWETADGDVRAQLLDTRVNPADGQGLKLIGDRDRVDRAEVAARPDVLIGSIRNDTLIGDRGDAEDGDSADDTLYGALGDDVLYGGGDNEGENTRGGDDDTVDELHGDEGFDTAAYRGARTQYSVTVNGDGGFTVRDMRNLPSEKGADPATDGTDYIHTIEQLAFGSSINTDYRPNDAVLTVGNDKVGMGAFFQDLPGTHEGLPAGAPTDGTPIGWGADSTAAFAVNTGALEAGPQDSVVTVGLFGAFAYLWRSDGNEVRLKVYDPLGEPSAVFAAGAAAEGLLLSEGDEGVSDLAAAIAGEGSVAAVWTETGAGPSQVVGRFVSSLDGALGGEFSVGGDATSEVDAKVFGYEVEDDLGAVELGFHVVYTEGAAGPGESGAIMLQRFSVYQRLGNPAAEPVETAPLRLNAETGAADPAAPAIQIGTGRSASVTHLHDGQLIVSWIDGGAIKAKVFALSPGGNGLTTFSPELASIEIPASVSAADAQEVVGLGFNFAIAYKEDGLVKARLYAPSADGYAPAGEATLSLAGTAYAGSTVGEAHLAPTDLDGSSFSLLVEVTNSGTTKVVGQLFDAAGARIGGLFEAFQGDARLGNGGFSASTLDDGRVVVGATTDGADPDVLGSLYDTRVPGEQIIGPRDGAPRDFIVGTIGNDVIDGRIQPDELYGLLGDDVILGGLGDDLMFGGKGNDTLIGGSEDDTLEGEDGDDVMLGGFGRDIIRGGDGSDTISYHGEFARFRIDLANQTMQSDRNPDTGATGNFAPEDTFSDIENATGGEANDEIVGSEGANVMHGRGGDDTFTVGDEDVVDGGDGANDTAIFTGAFGDFELLNTEGSTYVVTRTATGLSATVSNVEFLQFDDEQIDLSEPLPEEPPQAPPNVAPIITSPSTASFSENVPYGFEVMTLTAEDPGDTVTFSLAAGSDPRFTLNGDKLVATGRLDAGQAQVSVVATDDDPANPLSDAMEIIIDLRRDSPNIVGTNAGQRHNGTNFSERIFANGGNDEVRGRNGDDQIYGGAGNDTLRGDQGNDLFVGGAGNDQMQGEAGSDYFLFRGGSGNDTIRSFGDSSGDEDLLVFHQSIFADFSEFQSAVTTTRRATTIRLDDGGTVTLDGFRSALDQTDVAFWSDEQFRFYGYDL